LADGGTEAAAPAQQAVFTVPANGHGGLFLPGGTGRCGMTSVFCHFEKPPMNESAVFFAREGGAWRGRKMKNDWYYLPF
jgi:hypothetical protein